MTNREIMLSKLEKHTIASLSALGFMGKYPHYRRTVDDRIELISFQTNKYGGSFTIEVSAVFPYSSNKNTDTVIDDSINVTATNLRYRLPGMFDGWFYYQDVYCKYNLFFGKIYYAVSEKESRSFVAPKFYRPVQRFNEDTAVKVCREVNRQLKKAFRWLDRFAEK